MPLPLAGDVTSYIGKLSPLGLLVKMFLESSNGGRYSKKLLDLESERYAVQPFIIRRFGRRSLACDRNRIWMQLPTMRANLNLSESRAKTSNRPTQRIAGGDMQPLTNTNSIKRGQRETNAKHKTTGRTIHELIPTL
jgi:hypothetical protein